MTMIETYLPELASLWQQTKGHPDIAVAILDGSVDQSHPCFEGANLTQLQTLVSADQATPSHHGTHVASIIFGRHNNQMNGSEVHGIAPKSRGLILPIFGEVEPGRPAPCSQTDLARAITQAVEAGANVINISGGQLASSAEPEHLLSNAIRLCKEKNVLIVAAAGNDGCKCLHVPAAVDSVLAVGAMDADGKPLGFSNWGDAYQSQGILAPGQNILGAVPNGGTVMMSGTSFAAPIVSGIVALLLSIQVENRVSPDPAAVRAALLNTAHPCNPQETSDCTRFLAGVLNIKGAYEQMTKESRVEAEKVIMSEAINEFDSDEPMDDEFNE
ncbi:MAG: S8 family serine peptidase, partial [Chloroflexota bacterium]